MMFRWCALVVVIGCIGTSGYYRRRARREGGTIARGRESLGLKLGRSLVSLPLFGGVIAYLINPDWMAWSSLALPSWARWTGVALGASTIPAAQWVFRSIGKNVSETVLTKDRHDLVSVGPYRWIRHPLYATGIALFWSIGLMAASWFILLFALIATVLIRLVVIPLEERELLRKFGDHYARYMRRTGRLLPGLRTGAG